MKTSKQANLWQAINHQRMELSASGRSHFKAVLVLLLKLSVLEELLCKKPSETPYLYKLFNWHGTRSRNIGMEVHMDPLLSICNKGSEYTISIMSDMVGMRKSG